MHNRVKQAGKYVYGIAASVIITLSAGLRLFFLINNWPGTNSDEGTMGLMALHITHFTDFPVYFYGQGGTLGSLEAYMGALMFPLFGPTVFALRFGVLLFFILFLITMYLLTSLLYTKKLALLTLVLLSLGSSDLLYRIYEALAAHAETPLFGALLILVASKLALSAPVPGSSPARFRRLVGYGCWGGLVGLAFWNDPLTLPFILMSGVFLLIFCRHELQTPVLVSIFAGLMIGLFPVIIYNLTVSGIDKSSLSVFGFLVDADRPVPSDSILMRFAATFLVTFPVSTGAVPVCTMAARDAWPLSAQPGSQVLQCTTIHGVWSLALVVLWLLGVAIAIRCLRSLWRFQAVVPEKRREAVIQGARLMLLGSALLTLLSFALSVQAITDPWGHHRYLLAMAVATPALLWPLWRWFGSVSLRSRFKAVSIRSLCAAVILFYLATMALGTFQTVNQLPGAEATMQSQQALVVKLKEQHLTRMYTDYWTCDLTAFLSQEQIICSVLDEQLQPGFNRYQPYVSVVAQSPHVAYVFHRNSPQNRQFILQMGRDSNPPHYRITFMGDYVIYQR
ncbi:MAG TPA: hypothetical protein VF458_16815 [Ktedonobacteraceae bacterium]